MKVHTGLILSEWSTSQKHKRILHLCYRSAVTHLADVSPSVRISSCVRASVTRVRIQDPGCKHSTAALQMWQGTAELCPERSSLEGDAIKVHPLNPLAVLAQRSEQVHIWGGGGAGGARGVRNCFRNTERAKMTAEHRHLEHPPPDFGQLLKEQVYKHTLNSLPLRVTQCLFHNMYRLKSTRMTSIRLQTNCAPRSLGFQNRVCNYYYNFI